jgi:hypothetical protein
MAEPSSGEGKKKELRLLVAVLEAGLAAAAS